MIKPKTCFFNKCIALINKMHPLKNPINKYPAGHCHLCQMKKKNLMMNIIYEK